MRVLGGEGGMEEEVEAEAEERLNGNRCCHILGTRP